MASHVRSLLKLGTMENAFDEPLGLAAFVDA